jgi:zinc transporter ZupT
MEGFPVGFVIGLASGVGLGISVGIAIGRQQRPLTAEDEKRQRKAVTLGLGIVLLGVIAGLAVWWTT